MGHQFVPEVGGGGGRGREVGSHGVVSATVTQSVPEDVEPEAWSTSLCLRGEGGQSWGRQYDCHPECPG